MSTTLEQSPVEAPSSPVEMPYLFSVDEFYRMIELELFPRESRVSLWEGQVYQRMAKTQAHAVAGINVTMTLARALPLGWCLSSENPITVGPDKAPLPDMIVLRGIGNDYLDRRPEAADVGLVVEFSMSSLQVRHRGQARRLMLRPASRSLLGPSTSRTVVIVYSDPIPFGRPLRLRSITVKRGESIPFIARWNPNSRPSPRPTCCQILLTPIINPSPSGTTRRCPPLTPPRWKPAPPSSGTPMAA